MCNTPSKGELGNSPRRTRTFHSQALLLHLIPWIFIPGNLIISNADSRWTAMPGELLDTHRPSPHVNREASSQEKGLAGRIQSAKLSYKRSKRCLWVQRAGGWEDQMSVPTTNILCYLVCTVRDFRSPEVNLWHCTTQKVPSWKIFDSNIWQDLFFCISEKGWDWADPSEVPQLCLQRQFQCPADCFGCVFM